METKQEK